MSGTITPPAAVLIGKPGVTYQLQDQDAFQFLARAQRNF
jgi:hypothetical protein